jgi:hypothetical protein
LGEPFHEEPLLNKGIPKPRLFGSHSKVNREAPDYKIIEKCGPGVKENQNECHV